MTESSQPSRNPAPQCLSSNPEITHSDTSMESQGRNVRAERTSEPQFRELVSKESSPCSGLPLRTPCSSWRLVTRGRAFLLRWWAKGQKPKSPYFHGLGSYDNLMSPGESESMEIFTLRMAVLPAAVPCARKLRNLKGFQVPCFWRTRAGLTQAPLQTSTASTHGCPHINAIQCWCCYLLGRTKTKATPLLVPLAK